MIKSESIGKLGEALSKAQGEMRNAVKDSSNPFFKSKYADLASVSDACKAQLASNGIAVIHLPGTVDGKLVMEYLAIHSSGEYAGSSIDMHPVKTDPQGVGSAITYYRRYTLAAIAGVATEDDDGNAASNNVTDKTESKKPISFKKESVAPNSGTAGNGSAFVQKGESAPAAATDLEAQLEASVEAQYISVANQKEFHAECRKAAKDRNKADEHTYQWLIDNGYVKENGEPSASKIPAKYWPKAMQQASKWISVQ